VLAIDIGAALAEGSDSLAADPCLLYLGNIDLVNGDSGFMFG
jgi:hypothetical protein